MRQRPLDSIRIGTSSVSTDHLNFLMMLQPGQDRVSRAVRQEVEWLASLEIDEDRAIAVPTLDGEIINPDCPHRRLRSGSDAAHIAQQGRRLHLHAESGSQTLTHLSR